MIFVQHEVRLCMLSLPRFVSACLVEERRLESQ